MTRRSEQVAHQIQRYAAQALAELSLERSVLLTVTRTQVSPDMKQATVWLAGWAQLNPRQQDEAARAMSREVAQHMTTKFTPRLRVEADDSGEYASHISHILSDS